MAKGTQKMSQDKWTAKKEICLDTDSSEAKSSFAIPVSNQKRNVWEKEYRYKKKSNIRET